MPLIWRDLPSQLMSLPRGTKYHVTGVDTFFEEYEWRAVVSLYTVKDDGL